MTDITYKGSSDFRVLSAADLPGVEFRKTAFAKGTATSVSQEVADLLISDPDRFGVFELSPATDPTLFDAPENTDAEPAKKAVRAK